MCVVHIEHICREVVERVGGVVGRDVALWGCAALRPGAGYRALETKWKLKPFFCARLRTLILSMNLCGVLALAPLPLCAGKESEMERQREREGESGRGSGRLRVLFNASFLARAKFVTMCERVCVCVCWKMACGVHCPYIVFCAHEEGVTLTHTHRVAESAGAVDACLRRLR